MNTYVVSLIRTLVPILIGRLLALPIAPAVLSALGVHDTAKVSATVTALVIAGYYALVRLLETRWPEFGVLLGVPTPPKYPTPASSPTPPIVTPADPRQPAAGTQPHDGTWTADSISQAMSYSAQ